MENRVFLLIFKPHPEERHKYAWVKLIRTEGCSPDPEMDMCAEPGFVNNFDGIVSYEELIGLLSNMGQTNIIQMIDEAFEKVEEYRSAKRAISSKSGILTRLRNMLFNRNRQTAPA
jgi:hypothetical protein